MIHLFENDPRFLTDPTFLENHGSFSVINYGINNALKKINSYSDADTAKFVGFSTSLDLNTKYANSIPFYITVWETINTLTTHHINSTLNQNKIIFGMSDQITNLYKKHNIECRTLHCGCDTDFWKPSLPKNDKFTFIHVNSSNIRSGLDLTLLAFKQAFQNNKDVQLIVKDTYQSSILKNKINSLISDNCNIIYISDRFNRSQIKDLYSSSHIGLNLLRMTSWGFPLHEMSACGCLCVTGDFEPTNVLVKKNYGILIKPSREIDIFSNMGALVNDWGFHNPYGFDVFGYPENPRYYDFDVEEYASVLKELYYNWDRYKNIDTISPIRQNWTWEKTATNLLNMLKTI
jgi:glycosyltransferase involved in cell wall biosynthesis